MKIIMIFFLVSLMWIMKLHLMLFLIGTFYLFVTRTHYNWLVFVPAIFIDWTYCFSPLCLESVVTSESPGFHLVFCLCHHCVPQWAGNASRINSAHWVSIRKTESAASHKTFYISRHTLAWLVFQIHLFAIVIIYLNFVFHKPNILLVSPLTQFSFRSNLH